MVDILVQQFYCQHCSLLCHRLFETESHIPKSFYNDDPLEPRLRSYSESDNKKDARARMTKFEKLRRRISYRSSSKKRKSRKSETDVTNATGWYIRNRCRLEQCELTCTLAMRPPDLVFAVRKFSRKNNQGAGAGALLNICFVHDA